MFSISVLLLLLVLDLQLNLLFSHLFWNGLQPNYHLFLLCLVAMTSRASDFKLFYICLIVGILLDIYILNVLGLNMILLPLFVLLASNVFKIRCLRFWNFCLLSVVIVFLFEISHFLIAWLLEGMTYSWTYFIVKILAPTLILNLVVGILLYPLIRNILQRNRHLIVTNV
ncbi:rod shape-determining protein MreD [Streptococcus rupicaprae]